MFGFEVGVGFGERVIDQLWRESVLCATLALSSLTIDTPSKLLWFDEWQICLMLAMGLFNATNLHIE